MTRLSMHYGVTSKRLIFVTPLLGRFVRSLDLATLGEVEIAHHRGGLGTPTLSEARFGLLEGVSVEKNDRSPELKYKWIANPEAVRDINAARKKV